MEEIVALQNHIFNTHGISNEIIKFPLLSPPYGTTYSGLYPILLFAVLFKAPPLSSGQKPLAK